ADLDASGVDLICVIRGGGSLEDLWAFNELAVAEAIWAARVPVVTGVGHESDTTLADHVADHRAHTPTDAAQTVLPDLRQLSDRLERGGSYLIEAMHRHLSARIDRYKRIAQRRTLREPGWLLERRIERVAGLQGRLASAVGRRLERVSARVERCGGALASQSPASRLARLEARLEALAPRLIRAAADPLERRAQRIELAARSLQAVSPFAVLERGYSITQSADGRAVRSTADVEPGATLETVLTDGVLRSGVQEVRPTPADGSGAGSGDGAGGA
ncbi:MAG: exodeoxyribonuclease VII large subunit, partial [Planctomycetota bacterium]|nr:exodeoxyribonuclease VII large subunit [Planctomycetota bacterium]